MSRNYDRVLDWYREDRFTADDLARATGLSERAQRELLKLGVLQPIPQAKTKKRLVSARMVKRAAIVAPLSRCGLSLKVAGKIVFAAPSIEDLSFEIFDPLQTDPASVERRFFDPQTSPEISAAPPMGIQILNGTYVRLRLGEVDSGFAFGRLTQDGTDFIAWSPRVSDEHSPAERGGPPDRKSTLSTFRAELATKSQRAAAERARQRPSSTVFVDVGLSLVVTLRRLLRVDRAVTTREKAST